jgi:glycosyltransferase involved in cell wall biosynthesis
MLHIHQVNLQPFVGGGEIYTHALTRACVDAGATATLYAHPDIRLWDGIEAPGLDVVRVADEDQLLQRLPGKGAVVLTHSPMSVQCIERMSANHRVAGFAHMPMFQRSADNLRPYQLLFTVSRYCIGLLREAGMTQVYPEPVYGTGELTRSSEPVLRRSPLLIDRRKFRDILAGGLASLTLAGRRGEPFSKQPGLTLGLVSWIAPIKQFPALFAILAPILAQRPAVNLEIFGSGGYAQVRDLRRAVAPLGSRVRFWGHQANVSAIYPQLDYLMTGLPEKEALGLNVLEAQACGTPVLAPDAPPFTETVLDGASGFLYRDPRQDGGRHFEQTIDAILAGRPRPDPRIGAREHLAKFSYPALVERARGLIKALSDLE